MPHCYCLNLSIKDVKGSSKILSDVRDTAGEISVLIKFSQKREELLENLSEKLPQIKSQNFLPQDGQ